MGVYQCLNMVVVGPKQREHAECNPPRLVEPLYYTHVYCSVIVLFNFNIKCTAQSAFFEAETKSASFQG